MRPLALEAVINASSSWEQVGDMLGVHRTTAMRRARAAGLDHLLQSTKYIFGKAAGPMPRYQSILPKIRLTAAERDRESLRISKRASGDSLLSALAEMAKAEIPASRSKVDRIKLSRRMEESVVAAAEAGANVRQICEAMGVSHTWVVNFLQSKRVSTRRRGALALDDEDFGQMIDDSDDYCTPDEIADILAVSDWGTPW